MSAAQGIRIRLPSQKGDISERYSHSEILQLTINIVDPKASDVR